MARKTKLGDEMRSHYDFSGGERGKYAERYTVGMNVVVLAADAAAMFPDSIAVNEALHPSSGGRRKGKRQNTAPKKRRL
jgi:hypothetical protein